MSEENRPWARTILVATALAVVCAFLWWAWMGRLDRKTYTKSEVVGCGVCVALAVIAAMLAVPIRRAALMIVAATVGFSLSWAYSAASHDSTGLWPVGLCLLVVGMGFGLSVVWLIALGVHWEARERRPKP